MANQHKEDFPIVLTMRHVQQITGLSRDLVYRLPHQKGFPAIRFARVIRVPRDSFFAWLERQAVNEEKDHVRL